MKCFLKNTIYLLPIILMGVSFLSIILPWMGFNFDFTTWGNIAGFSLVTDVLFFYVFYYGKYCIFTKLFPIVLFAVNIVNIWGYYFPTNYSQWYEIIIFSCSASLLGIYQLKRLLNR